MWSRRTTRRTRRETNPLHQQKGGPRKITSEHASAGQRRSFSRSCHAGAGIIEPHSDALAVGMARIACQAANRKIRRNTRRLGKVRIWWRRRCSRVLISAIILIRHPCPSIAVRRDAQHKFLRRHGGAKIRFDGAVNVEVFAERGIFFVIE